MSKLSLMVQENSFNMVILVFDMLLMYMFKKVGIFFQLPVIENVFSLFTNKRQPFKGPDLRISLG